MNTRHFLALVIGAITSVMSTSGFSGHDFPTLLQYVQANAIPAIGMFADWIHARIKEWRGVTGYASFMVALQASVNASPELKAALEKLGLKIPA